MGLFWFCWSPLLEEFSNPIRATSMFSLFFDFFGHVTNERVRKGLPLHFSGRAHLWAWYWLHLPLTKNSKILSLFSSFLSISSVFSSFLWFRVFLSMVDEVTKIYRRKNSRILWPSFLKQSVCHNTHGLPDIIYIVVDLFLHSFPPSSWS